MNRDIEVIQEKIQQESAFISRLVDEVGRVIVGQKYMVERLLIGLLGRRMGTCSWRGVPGLAKTLTVRMLAQAIQTSFQRLQFTPDLLPADLIGTLIYDPKDQEFKTKKGPLFANIILADEINRATGQGAVGAAGSHARAHGHHRRGPHTAWRSRFWCLATQNPIEQEGTYPLPGGAGGSVHVEVVCGVSHARRTSWRSCVA